MESFGIGRMERKQPESELLKNAREIELNGYLHHAALHDPGGEDPKQYHISEHPHAVAERAERIADIFNLPEEDRAIVRMAIAWHDTVMEYDAADPGNVASRIRRHRGAREGDTPSGSEGNEAQSARLLKKEMEDANQLAGHEIFSERQISTAVWAVDATYPDVHIGSFRDYPFFGQALLHNPALTACFSELERGDISQRPLFFQPHLEQPLERGKKVPREVLIVALADLDQCGMGSSLEFSIEGDREMRELYANLQNPLVLKRIIDGTAEQDKFDRSKVKEECLAWLKSQAGFAAWQALRFEKIFYLLKEQHDLSDDEERALRQQFNHFVDNVRASSERASQLQALYDTSFRVAGEGQAVADLLKTMGYPVES
ncbi:MAG: hypothetical protein ACREGH_04000 [Minisyncoccia bacterium]